MQIDILALLNLWLSMFGQFFSYAAGLIAAVWGGIIALNAVGFILTRKFSTADDRRDAGIIFIIIQLVSSMTLGFLLPIIGSLVVALFKKKYVQLEKLRIPFALANWINLGLIVVLLFLLLIL